MSFSADDILLLAVDAESRKATTALLAGGNANLQ